MTDKTKATLQGRPSNTNKSTIDITRPCAGGQSLTDALNSASTNIPNIVGLVEPTILKLLATFRGLVEPTILKRVANLQLGLGCAENFGHLIVGYAPLQHTPITTHILGRLVCLTGYAKFWAHLDSGHCSLLGCTPLPYTPDVSRNSGYVKTSNGPLNFSRCSYVSNGQLNFEPTDFIQVFGSSLACLRRRRLISACMAALMNCPVLSPDVFTCSIPSMSSCAIRAVTDCDLAFFVPVAMPTSSIQWCKTIYTVFYLFKDLTCKTPLFYFVSYTLCCSWCENSEAPQVLGTPAGPLTKPLIGVTVMAESQHTQSRPEFTWRFLSVSARSPEAKPIVIYVNASSEHEARDTMPGVHLIFAARLPFHAFQVLGVHHV